LWELRVRRDGWSVEEGLVKGREPPDWYLDQPELLRGDELFMRAYWVLDSERPSGFGLCRIPWSKTIAYGERIGLERDVCDMLWTVVSAMDFGYLGFMSKKSGEDAGRARRSARRRARSGTKAPKKSGGRRYKR